MKKINLAITGCLGRMGQQLIKSSKENGNFKLVTLTENVLINSNFNCGYYINREKLYNILRNKYNINAIYDPCSYPGIRCIYYYNFNDKVIKISYMIFRTGSILIVGKCNESVLKIVYEYIKTLLMNEYINIKSKITVEAINIEKTNHKKAKKKKIIYQTIKV